MLLFLYHTFCGFIISCFIYCDCGWYCFVILYAWCFDYISIYLMILTSWVTEHYTMHSLVVEKSNNNQICFYFIFVDLQFTLFALSMKTFDRYLFFIFMFLLFCSHLFSPDFNYSTSVFSYSCPGVHEQKQYSKCAPSIQLLLHCIHTWRRWEKCLAQRHRMTHCAVCT